MNAMTTTFSNLQVLKKEQMSVKAQLGENYTETIKPFYNIIQMVMKANEFNEFEAMKKIKDELPIYKKPDVPLLFTAALIDITEEKNFVGFRE